MTPGVQLGDRFVSQQTISERAAKASTGFDALGIKRADSVALMLRNDFSYLEATQGARNIGALPVPINWHLSAEETNYILRDSEAKALVVHEDILSRLEGAIPDEVHVFVVPTPEEISEAYQLSPGATEGLANSYDWNAWIEEQKPWDKALTFETSSMIYTSGTTGRPKGVRRAEASLEQYQKTLQLVAGILGVEPGIRTIIPAPLYHSAPNAYAYFAHQLGCFIVLQPRFDPEEFLALIEKFKINRVQMVPTMFIRLLKLPQEVRDKYDLSSLEYIIHAAAPCPPHIKQAMIDWWGPVINEYYGSTEMGAVTICNSEDAIKYPGTVGKPVDGATLRIYGEDGQVLPVGETGTVYGMIDIATDFTYQGDDEKRRSIELDGLITSGDIGYFNEEGYLFLCDRASDMVISGGVNIYPAEIESVLSELPGVKDCAVFGIPDEDFGESLAAIIEPEDDSELTQDSVIAYLSDRLAKYKVPRLVEFRTDLPREDSGKLFKRRLREPFWKDAGRNI